MHRRAFTVVHGLKPSFSPRQLFAAGEQGVWYDPSDFSTMFQDAAGTTPVTTVEQPVGLIFDKSGRGNHASQAAATSKPTLRNLYNGLEYTEQFDKAYWAKAPNCSVGTTQYVSPIGDNTAEKIQVNSNGQAYVVNTALGTTNLRGASVTLSYSFAPAGKGFAYVQVNETAGGTLASTTRVNLATGATQTVATAGGGLANVTGSAIGQSNGYYRLTMSFTLNAASTSVQSYLGPCDSLSTSSSTASGTDGVYVWGASFVPTNESSLPYQRVVTNTLGSGVYDTDLTKFKPYLYFDGVDDCLLTSAIDFSTTDAISVFAGIRKLSDAKQQPVVELSATIASNNGSFLLSAPNSAAANYNFSSKGTSQVDNTVTTYAAPITNVVTGLARISTPINTIRVNGVEATVASSQGTGNYGPSHVLCIGRRNNADASLIWIGRVYSLIIRGAMTSSSQLARTETWVNSKTGAY